MPNLKHDSQNPTDLLDRPIKEGDIVAWGTTYGRSAAVAVCRIEKIRFIRKGGPWNDHRGNVEVPQDQADDYQLILRPLKSTGSVSIPEKYHPNGYIDPATGSLARHEDGGIKYFEQLSDKPNVKNVKLVKNVVKLEPLDA